MKRYIQASGSPAYIVEHAYWSAFNLMRFQQPEPAIKAWLRKNDTFYGDVVIHSDSEEDTRRLYEWVVNNEDRFIEISRRYLAPYCEDYIKVCRQKLESGDIERGWIPPFTTFKESGIF